LSSRMPSDLWIFPETRVARPFKYFRHDQARQRHLIGSYVIDRF
jgi:hypothetical protein